MSGRIEINLKSKKDIGSRVKKIERVGIKAIKKLLKILPKTAKFERQSFSKLVITY